MPTQLLLLEDVEDVGRSGDIVKVKPGYARNYLLPKSLAVVADKNALRMQEKLKEERKKRAAEDLEESKKIATVLTGKTFSIDVKVDPEGHMYGSVSTNDIAKIIEDEEKIILEKKAVQLKHPIKQTGVYPIVVKLKEGVTSEVVLKVIPEGGTLEEPVEETPKAEEENSEAKEEEEKPSES